MKRITLILSIFLLCFALQGLSQNDNKHLIHYEGKPIFINGINVAWNNFGGDVGIHKDWGAQYDSAWFEKLFKGCEAYGVNCVRLWIHIDGRANPEFDKNGFVTGVDAEYYNNLDDIFRKAKNHGVFIMPVLWSFDMCKDFTKEAGSAAGKHHDLISDSLKTVSYVDKVLIPMVKRYENQCNLFAWEVCNEPEWAIDRPGDKWDYKSDFTVSLTHMQRFHAMIAAAIHKNSKKMVTTGSAALRWNSDVAPALGNIWSDAALQKAYNDKDAYFDFYQIHYYDYMHNDHFDPFDLNYPFEYWKLDKPCLIGEQPANDWRDTLYKNDVKVENAYKNKYAGHMFWSYNGYDKLGHWDEFKDECKDFCDLHRAEVFPFTACKTMTGSFLNFKVEKGKGKNKLSWKSDEPELVMYYEVEKSTDGVNFKWERRILKNENNDPNYFYNDKTEGKVFYRIKYKTAGGFEGVSEIFVAE